MLFDPAMLQDIQVAMMPPLAPPAIERAWQASPAERGARVDAYLAEEEARAEVWRTNLAVWVGSFQRVRGVPRSVTELEILDGLKRKTKLRARELTRDADRSLKRRIRLVSELHGGEPGMEQRAMEQVIRAHRLEVANATAMMNLAKAMQDYADVSDYRGRATFGADVRDFRPNAETVAAMEDARAGVDTQRLSGIADLMAELHAEGD